MIDRVLNRIRASALCGVLVCVAIRAIVHASDIVRVVAIAGCAALILSVIILKRWVRSHPRPERPKRRKSREREAAEHAGA